jgi:hypothetical protein
MHIRDNDKMKPPMSKKRWTEIYDDMNWDEMGFQIHHLEYCQYAIHAVCSSWHPFWRGVK